MESKKAQNLSITTIILIILGVVVLVVLIIGFTQGWGSVKGFFTGGQSELSLIASQCSIACATNDEVSWCEERTMKVDGEDVTGTCTYFAASYSSVEECPEMPACFEKKTTINCEGYEYEPGEEATSCNKAKYTCDSKGTVVAPPGIMFVEASTDLCCKGECVSK